MAQKSIFLDEDLWSKIDVQRGGVPRSRFIAKILADSLESKKKKSGVEK